MKTEKMVAALGVVGFCGLVFVIVASSLTGCGDDSAAPPITIGVLPRVDVGDTGTTPDVETTPDADSPETQEDGSWTLPETCEKDEDCAAPGTWDWCSATMACNIPFKETTGACEPRELPCQESVYVGCADQHCLACKDDDTATWQNCSDGVGCTAEFCTNGDCQYGKTQGWCLIDSSCYEAGEKSAATDCAICDPDVSQDDFTPRADGLACDASNPCTIDDVCSQGKCESTTPKSCNDGNVCTADSCVSWVPDGCVYDAVADGTACADENLCNGQEMCNAGNCAATNPLVCNDGDVCNGIETCEATIGCITGVTLVCNDGLPCNGEESCDKATGCVVGTSPEGCCTGNADCDDGNPCNGVQACVTQTCKLLAEPLVCDDKDVCNGSEICNPTKGCTSTPAPNCDDGNQCTTDSCDPTKGCINPFDVVCDDGVACTDDVCDAESGCKYAADNVECDDSDACTTDSCDTAKGCINEAVAENACNDSDACTTDSCDTAKGCVNETKGCDDGVACTLDSCDVFSGCKNTPDNTKCEDGNKCTTNVCSPAKGCSSQVTFACDDSNLCTEDSCDPATGACANFNPCDDGDACTQDICGANGTCVYEQAKVCNDGNPCTTDSCDPTTGGCVYGPSSGAACNDGNPCTTSDICVAGTCAGTTSDYDKDGNPDGEDNACDHTYDVYKGDPMTVGGFTPPGWNNQCGVGGKIADGKIVVILFRWEETPQSAVAYGFCTADKDVDGYSVISGAKPGGDCDDESPSVQFECTGGKPLPASVGDLQATIPTYLAVVVHPGEECPCLP